MKITHLLLATTLVSGWTTVSYTAHKQTPKKDIIKIDDLRTAIGQEINRQLHERSIEAKYLPRYLAIELDKKIDAITAQISNNLHLQQKTEIALAVLQKDITVAITDLVARALAVVSRKILTKTIEDFIGTLTEEKSVVIEKLPENMRTEFAQRCKAILNNLNKIMQADGRDYVFVSELEQECHKTLNLFLDRAKYVLLSLQGQSVMATLDSLRFVTNTQPFPIKP